MLVEIVNCSPVIEEEHACEDAEPRREGIWNHCLHMESLTCCGMRLIMSYTISVAITA